MAVTNDGTVMAWGGNENGQLGNGDSFNNNQHTAIAIPTGLLKASDVAAGSASSFAI